jgi:hypothetical protein
MQMAFDGHTPLSRKSVVEGSETDRMLAILADHWLSGGLVGDTGANTDALDALQIAAQKLRGQPDRLRRVLLLLLALLPLAQEESDHDFWMEIA